MEHKYKHYAKQLAYGKQFAYLRNLATMALAVGTSLIATDANAFLKIGYEAPIAIGSNVSFSDSFSTPTSFNDLFLFTVTSPSNAGGYAVSSPFSTPATSSVPWPVSFTSFNLMNESTPTPSIVAGGTGTIGPSFFAYFVNPVVLTPGTLYGLNITGNSLAGGSYTGSLTVTNGSITLVPEPSTWAMMLGGLGLIGFMSYRRRQYF
jgi:hypothetical protein